MKALLIAILIGISVSSLSQQKADMSYIPEIAEPHFKKGQGPVVLIDEAHNNFHTREGRYAAFSLFLGRDGYTLRSNPDKLNKSIPAGTRILVISNALNDVNSNGNWHLPTPSAFTSEEIKTIVEWVKAGGSLFLIADHMPFAGAASALAKEFDFHFTNGFVFDDEDGNVILFKPNQGLVKDTLTVGIEQIASFTGQAFRTPKEAQSILQFNDHHINYMPDTAWVFNSHTPKLPVKGWSQLAYRTFGKGKVVVSGEAAMFTAQLSGSDQHKFGMNNPDAKDNAELLRRLLFWLAVED